MRVGSLCTGYGGLDHAVGGDMVWLSEFNKSANVVCETRFPGVPNIGDLTKVPWEKLDEIDVLIAGFPCQPFSTAGKGRGVNDSRHLWPFIFDGIRAIRPRSIVMENVAGFRKHALHIVLGNLAEIGYDARWVSLRASDIGAPHRRDRVFLVGTDKSSVFHADNNGGGSWVSRSARPLGSWGGPDHGFGKSGEGSEKIANWGRFAPAITRWEKALGRPAPVPTIEAQRPVAKDWRTRLNPRFVEWMMGLPDGWVTGCDISLDQQLKILGNGVCPQQANEALARIGIVL